MHQLFPDIRVALQFYSTHIISDHFLEEKTKEKLLQINSYYLLNNTWHVPINDPTYIFSIISNTFVALWVSIKNTYGDLIIFIMDMIKVDHIYSVCVCVCVAYIHIIICNTAIG